MPPPRQGSTVRARRLRLELRGLRDVAGLTIEETARRLEWSMSKISRIETGKVGVSPGDVRELLDVYGVGVTDERYDALVRLARDAARRVQGWWHEYADLLPGAYAALEAESSRMRTFQPQLVPGLLQTEAYFRALVEGERRAYPAEEIERRVAVRMSRQLRLEGEEPLRLWAVLHEAALRCQVGGPAVMRDQLDRLTEAAQRPNVTLQVLPFEAGAHASMAGAFAMLDFPDPLDPSVVLLEPLHGGVFVEEPVDVEHYDTAFDYLRADAMGDRESAAWIATLAKEMR